MGLGGLAFAPFVNSKKEIPEFTVNPDEKKLHIICVGAHPGDPEFGCGGTMAKYSNESQCP